MEEKILVKGQTLKISEIPAFSIIAASIVILYVILFSMGCSECCGLEGFLFSLPVLIAAVVFVITCVACSKCEITATDKRVYGKTLFGKRVDLPMDSISAVGTSIFYGFDVGTSSGKIKFKLIKNKDEIHEIISNLLMKRQQMKNTGLQEKTSAISATEELKNYKDLLDSGVITQEEFDAKKKQLLNM